MMRAKTPGVGIFVRLLILGRFAHESKDSQLST
jgi:hypothetical protein